MAVHHERDLRRSPLVSISDHEQYVEHGFRVHEPFDPDELYRVLQELGVQDFRAIVEHVVPRGLGSIPRIEVSGLSYSRELQDGSFEFLLLYLSLLESVEEMNSEGVVGASLRYEGSPSTCFTLTHVNMSGDAFGTEFVRWSDDETPWKSLPLPSLIDARCAYEHAAAQALLNSFRNELFISYGLCFAADVTEWERKALTVPRAKLYDLGFESGLVPAGISEKDFEIFAAMDAEDMSDLVFTNRDEEGILEVSQVFIRESGSERVIVVLFHASTETDDGVIRRDAEKFLEGRLIYYQWMNFEVIRKGAILEPYRYGSAQDALIIVAEHGGLAEELGDEDTSSSDELDAVPHARD